MGLLDHFHEPLNPRARWESFHHRWANALADALDGTLPPSFYASVEVHHGTDVASDVAEFESETDVSLNGNGGGVALQTYAPPATSVVIPAKFLDETEIQVRAQAGERLLGVIELVSVSNKSSPTNRLAFAAKMAAYLLSGVGIVVIDPVTSSHFNLHNEFIEMLGLGREFGMSEDTTIYFSAYRPTSDQLEQQIDTWFFPTGIGQSLPTVPFYLRGFGCIPLDLEATYTDTRRRCNLL